MSDKRYLIFGYDNFYPAGGMCDLIDSNDDKFEVRKRVETADYQYFEIYDKIEGEMLYSTTDEIDHIGY